jgi:integrase
MKPIGHSPSYIIRNPYGYCFRMMVPLDLRATLGKKELRYALKTGYLGVAKSKARLLAGQMQLFFKYLRSNGNMDIPLPQVQETINRLMRGGLIGLEAFKLVYGESEKDLLNKHQGMIEMMTQGLKLELANCNTTAISGIVDMIIAEQDDLDIKKDSFVYKVFGRELLKALIKYAEIEGRRAQGDFSDDIAKVFPIREDAPSYHESPKKDAGDPISEVAKRYVEDVKGNWKEKRTQDANVKSIELLVEVHGDIGINTVGRKKASEFKQIIRKLPSRRNVKVEYREKSILELLEMDIKEEDRLANRTVNQYLQRVGALFIWAKRNGYYDDDNPFEGLSIPLEEEDDDRRQSYTSEELGRLLASEQYVNDTFDHPYQFWTPVIALFHGMRQTEIAQLYVSDIKKSEDGIWYFDINKDTKDKKLKTQSSKRVVPIHQFVLKDLNLLGFCERLKKDGQERLFPELKHSRDGYGQRVSKWYNDKYKGKCGIKSTDEEWRDFHSFRTTFCTELAKKRVGDIDIEITIGHSVKKSTLRSKYIRLDADHIVKTLNKHVISEVSYEVDLFHLKKSKYVPKE